ncbi:MAG: LpxI family protein [Alphaproteobacteria bacterium]|nr:LpxI family protein [Alphaproteobacteria bacterium]
MPALSPSHAIADRKGRLAVIIGEGGVGEDIIARRPDHPILRDALFVAFGAAGAFDALATTSAIGATDAIATTSAIGATDATGVIGTTDVIDAIGATDATEATDAIGATDATDATDVIDVIDATDAIGTTDVIGATDAIGATGALGVTNAAQADGHPSQAVDAKLVSTSLEPLLALLQQANCQRVTAAGKFRRHAKVDFFAPSVAWMVLHGALKGGDDRAIRLIIQWFAKRGIEFVPLEEVVAIDKITGDNLPPAHGQTNPPAHGQANPAVSSEGMIRARAFPREESPEAIGEKVGETIDDAIGEAIIDPQAMFHQDATRGIAVLDALSPVDVGQAVVVHEGIVLAIEAAEGTDAMIRRAGALRQGLLDLAHGGVLVKTPKKTQLSYADPPCIGPDTLRHAIAAGLSGLVVTEGVMVLHRDEVYAVAAEHGFTFSVF